MLNATRNCITKQGCQIQPIRNMKVYSVLSYSSLNSGVHTEEESSIANNWEGVSKKLNNEGVHSSFELMEALFANGGNYREKIHWWKFLSEQISGIPVENLKRQATEIKKQNGNWESKEKQYCELLRFVLPFRSERFGDTVTDQFKAINTQVPPEIVTPAWQFRWVYTYPGRTLEGGITLGTLKKELKKGKITGRVFKHASFTTKVRNGTPEKVSREGIEVNNNFDK